MVEYSLSEWTKGKGKFLVAVKETDNKKIVGCLTFKMKTEKEAELHKLAVPQEMRFRGIAKLLCDTLCKYLKEQGTLILGPIQK